MNWRFRQLAGSPRTLPKCVTGSQSTNSDFFSRKFAKTPSVGLKPVNPSECQVLGEISPFGRNDKSPSLCDLAPLREVFRNLSLRLLRTLRLFFSDAVDASNRFA